MGKPTPQVSRPKAVDVQVGVGQPTIRLSRRAGRFEVSETVPPGAAALPADLESALDPLTKTGRVERRLGRLELYFSKLASGVALDEPFFGAGIFLDVPGHPWPAFCEVDGNNRPLRLRPAVLKQVQECAAAKRTTRPGRRGAGAKRRPTWAECFKGLAVTLGHIGSEARAANVLRMARAGKAALRDPK